MIVLIDNYDSFTYNLVQRLGEIDPGIDLFVARNDQVTLDEIDREDPSHIIISPGPARREAGVSNAVVEHFGPKVPLLGVCLGHQCIGHTFGANVVAPTGSCTARPRGFTTTATASTAASRTRSRRPATTAS